MTSMITRTGMAAVALSTAVLVALFGAPIVPVTAGALIAFAWNRRRLRVGRS
jgi:hypothetical protein